MQLQSKGKIIDEADAFIERLMCRNQMRGSNLWGTRTGSPSLMVDTTGIEPADRRNRCITTGGLGRWKRAPVSNPYAEQSPAILNRADLVP